MTCRSEIRLEHPFSAGEGRLKGLALLGAEICLGDDPAAGTGQAVVCYRQRWVDNLGMAQGRDVPKIDPALEAVVGAIDALTEPQEGGPAVVLTLGGLVVSGTVIPAWQWFQEVEHSARAAFVVHVGGSIDDEHGGWARLFRGAAESVARDHAERRAALQATEGLPDRYRRLVVQQDQTVYIHLTEARIVATGVSPVLASGMHWRGRLSEIAGWSFGHLGVEPSTAPAQDADHYM